MEKVFKCLRCQKDIRLERKADNSGWNKYNIDGTPHVDEKKKGGNNATAEKIAQLSEEVKGLKETVNTLISQIQMLRSDVKKRGNHD